MMRLTFQQVCEWTGGQAEGLVLDQPVRLLSIDSRDAAPDVLFVALPGTRTDGHEFVGMVWAAGGVALVRRDFAGRGGPMIRVDSPLDAMGQLLRSYIDAHQITVVGVTGSVGKTSVKELCAAVLSTRYVTTSSLGNYNTVIGLPLSFFAGPVGTTHFVAEMGMRQLGEIRHLTEIAPPDVAVISTIGPSHLEMMGSMQAIQRAKGEILEGLKSSGLAVLNRDNPWVKELGERCRKRVVWFGQGSDVDVRVTQASVGESATEIGLEAFGQPVTIRLPWLGAHHAYNVAAALAVGRELGISLEEARHGMGAVQAERSRIKVLHLRDITLLEDVYNSSPMSAKAALDVLASRTGRRLAVLGDMSELGQEEISGHRDVGTYALGRADVVLAVGSRAHHVFEAAHQAGVEAYWQPTRETAAEWLLANLRAGDVVLLKASRGMEFEWLTGRIQDARTTP